MTTPELDGPVAAIAALADPLRRALYRFVASVDRAVSRDEAGEAVGVPRSTAAFHLDRMVDDGLLETEFRRLGGRRGPGAGRPSKLYRRAPREIAVSLPARHYDLAADLLATAVTEATAGAGDVPVDAALRRVARRRGEEMAASLPAGGQAEDVALALAGNGYEPRVGDREIVLSNCPFHTLAARHTELVCGMNLALLEGFAEALPDLPMAARLRPTAGACCVRLELEPPI